MDRRHSDLQTLGSDLVQKGTSQGGKKRTKRPWPLYTVAACCAAVFPHHVESQAGTVPTEYGVGMNSSLPVSAVSTVLYHLRSVTATATPSDCEGTWFRYVIAHGANEITGLRTGSAESVEVAVREMVEHLNVRSSGKTVKKIKHTGAAAPSRPAVVAIAQP